MRSNIIHLLCLAIGFAVVFACQAQTKPLPEIPVDLGSGVVSGNVGLPFDIPFRFKGPTTPNLRKISLTYKASRSCADKSKLLWEGNTKPAIWNYVGDQTSWTLPVGPIHPNVEYDFTFRVSRIMDVKASDKEKFKQEAYKILQHFYDNPKGISVNTITETNNALNAQLKILIPPGHDIVYPNGDVYLIDINSSPFNYLLNSLKEIKHQQMTMQTDLESLRNAFTKPEFKYNEFQTRLANILNDPDLLDISSKKIFDGLIDPGNLQYKAVKMIDIGNLAKLPTHHIDDVFEGKLTLNNNEWIGTQTPDVELMRLLYQFYYKLSGNLDMASGDKVFTDADIGLINVLLVLFKGVVSKQVLSKQLIDSKEDVLAKFPDVLADKLIAASYTVSDQSYIDAVSQSTPYIGLDVGLSYIPGYSQLFIYEGINFYFMPINKDAPLSYFKGRYWWLKRLSVHLGLTQNLIKVENKRYIPLIDGVGSLLLGAGLRINRVIRLNAGYMFFYEKDNNPLIDKKHFTAMPQFSFTFDINVGRALGGVGTRLKINP